MSVTPVSLGPTPGLNVPAGMRNARPGNAALRATAKPKSGLVAVDPLVSRMSAPALDRRDPGDLAQDDDPPGAPDRVPQIDTHSVSPPRTGATVAPRSAAATIPSLRAVPVFIRP